MTQVIIPDESGAAGAITSATYNLDMTTCEPTLVSVAVTTGAHLEVYIRKNGGPQWYRDGDAKLCSLKQYWYQPLGSSRRHLTGLVTAK